MATRKIVLITEYDGTDYHGFQLQLNQPTVQGEIETAFSKLTGEEMRVIAASRTDSGVHARGQVVSLRTGSLLPPKTFVKGLNYYLPGDIAVKAAYGVKDSFDVRRQAISREYDYSICNCPTRSPLKQRFSYPVAESLDMEAMNKACQALSGEHDFASFATRVGRIKTTVRTVYQAEVKSRGELVVFTIVANSFLPHQVRNTMGSLIKVGLGKMNVEEFCSIIEAKTYGLAGPTVPACGLCLERVNYPVPWGEINENI